jgi:APA family basic amino acid/polyamine antiporter
MVNENKKIGVVTLTGIVIGNTIGSGVFLIPSALARLGSFSLLAWIFTAIGALIIAFVFSRMSSLMPKTGGPYAYVRAGLGDTMGFQTAFTYWIYAWTGNMALVIAAVGYLSVFFPELSNPLISSLTAVGLIWILTFVNLFGVKISGSISLITTILKLCPIILIALFGWFYFHPEYITQSLNVTTPKLSNFDILSQGAILTLWAFVGIESGTVPAEYVKNPERTIPIAIIAGMLITTIVIICSSIAIAGMIPNANLQNSIFPFADAAQIILGDWGKWLAAIGAIISCLGCVNGWILIQGQIPMVAAEDKLFFKIFARKNKNGIPVFGVVLTSMIISLFLLMTSSPDLVNQYKLVILMATITGLIAYLYTPVAELLMHKRGIFTLSNKSIIIAVCAIFYSLWAIWGAGVEVLSITAFLLFISVPLYYFCIPRKG